MLTMNNFPIFGACMYQFASRSLQWLFRSVMLLDVLAIENHHCVEASAKCDPSLEFLTGNLTWFNCTSLYFDLPWNIDNFNHWKGPMSPLILDKLWPHPAQEVMGETFQMDQDITFRIQNQLDLAWWIVIVQSYYPDCFAELTTYVWFLLQLETHVPSRAFPPNSTRRREVSNFGPNMMAERVGFQRSLPLHEGQWKHWFQWHLLIPSFGRFSNLVTIIRHHSTFCDVATRSSTELKYTSVHRCHKLLRCCV